MIVVVNCAMLEVEGRLSDVVPYRKIIFLYVILDDTLCPNLIHRMVVHHPDKHQKYDPDCVDKIHMIFIRTKRQTGCLNTFENGEESTFYISTMNTTLRTTILAKI